MANSLTALNAEKWSREVQDLLYKRLVARNITSSPSVDISDGATIHKPYYAGMNVYSYTRGTDVSLDDMTATDESYNIDQFEVVAGYLDKIDAVQNSYSAREIYTKEMAEQLKKRIDGKILAEYSNATSTVDAGDVGGTDSTSITLSSSNIAKVFLSAGKYLDNLNVDESERFAVVSPSFAAELELLISGKDTQMGDAATMNGAGFMMNRFGFYIYKSNNLTYTARWTPADQPSDGDTITINGVTIYFETGAIDTAGKVLSEVSVEVTLDNLVAFLNDPANKLSSAKYCALSQANIRLLGDVVATDGTTYLGLQMRGGGEITVAASEANDPWTVKTVHNLFGQKGATELAMQMAPSIGFNQEPKRPVGSGNLIALDMYGYKTWLRNKDMLVDVQVAQS